MAAVVSGVTREPGSRGRKGAPKRASEAVDESIIPKSKAPRKRQEKNAHLAPALPADVKRVRTASTKYDGSFAVAMPTKGSRAKDDEYYVAGFDEPMVGRYFRTDEPLYSRSNKGRKQPEESPSSSTGGDDEGTPEMWAEITDYVDDVAKSGTLSQTEMTRLRRLARQRSEPLRRVYGLWKHSHSRFVNNVMGLLNEAAADD